MACMARQSDNQERRPRCIMPQSVSNGPGCVNGMCSYLSWRGQPGATEAAGQSGIPVTMAIAARAPLSRTLARPYANLGRAPVNQQRPRFTRATTDRQKATGASSRHTRPALWLSENPRVPTPAGPQLLGEEICRQGRHQCRYSYGRERGKGNCAALRQRVSTSWHRPRPWTRWSGRSG